MLAIGRALMSRPRLLLLDEPSLGLAPILVQQIFSLITEINEQGITILLVEQNAMQALAIAHRGYVLQTGKVILADTAAGAGRQRGRPQGLPGRDLTSGSRPGALQCPGSGAGTGVSHPARGASRTCSGGPSSSTTPPSRKITRSAASRANAIS